MNKFIKVLIKDGKKYSDLSSLELVIITLPSSIISFYCGLMVSTVILDMITKTNEYGLSLSVSVVWVLLGFYIIVSSYFASIALRCRALLHERWFK